MKAIYHTLMTRLPSDSNPSQYETLFCKKNCFDNVALMHSTIAHSEPRGTLKEEMNIK